LPRPKHTTGKRRPAREGRVGRRLKNASKEKELTAGSSLSEKINRSHAHAHDSRTNHSNEHRACNGAMTLNSRSRRRLPRSSLSSVSSYFPCARSTPTHSHRAQWESGRHMAPGLPIPYSQGPRALAATRLHCALSRPRVSSLHAFSLPRLCNSVRRRNCLLLFWPELIA